MNFENLILSVLLASCTPVLTTTAPVSQKNPSKEIWEAGVLDIASKSSCAQVKWKDRGRAPMGYMKGMALLYAKHLCKPLNNPKKNGALEWYGLENSPKNLFNLLIGLGLRESSGKYCCGRDMSANFSSQDGAEAGAFQTSWNAKGNTGPGGNPDAKKEMIALFQRYSKDQSECQLQHWKEGVNPAYCSGSNAKNWGDPNSDGYKYQQLSKICPEFHAEFTLFTIQNTYRHHGPLIHKAAEFRSECINMLTDIEKFVAENGCLK